jgi:hypothetical protein
MKKNYKKNPKNYEKKNKYYNLLLNNQNNKWINE